MASWEYFAGELGGRGGIEVAVGALRRALDGALGVDGEAGPLAGEELLQVGEDELGGLLVGDLGGRSRSVDTSPSDRTDRGRFTTPPYF